MDKKKKVLIVNGKTEKQIMQQIIDMKLEKETLIDVLDTYENSTGLDNLIENMSKFFEVQ